MSEFDQLIKQKIDQQKYEYSAKSWQKFTEKAGWKAGLTTLQITAIATISAVIISVVGYVGYQFIATESQSIPTPPAASTIKTTDSTSTVAVDTTEPIIETVPETSTVDHISVSENRPQKRDLQSVTNDNETVSTIQKDTISQQNQVVKRKHYTGGIRKITIIDLDSIKTNDF